MPITIYPGSMKKRNANGSYSDLVPAIATDPEVLDDFAEEYSTSETYNIGDYCIHNSDLYKCNTNNTTGTWNNNAWDRVTVGDELAVHKNTLTQLGDGLTALENGLAYINTGNTATRPYDAGSYIYVKGNSNIPENLYVANQNISSGTTLTSGSSGNLTQESGVLNQLNGWKQFSGSTIPANAKKIKIFVVLASSNTEFVGDFFFDTADLTTSYRTFMRGYYFMQTYGACITLRIRNTDFVVETATINGTSISPTLERWYTE